MHSVKIDGGSIPKLGFGTFRMSGEDVRRMIPSVLETGYRHVDTAQIYGNEDAVGDGLVDSGVRRSDVFLTTKIWVDHYRYDDMLRSMDDSLKKLKTDHVDLLLLHWPSSAVSLEEQIRGLNAIASAGKTRHIGVSNFSTALMKASAMLSEKPLVTNQVEYHPYLDQTKVLTTARELGMCVTAYYAMADGKVLQDETIRAIAAKHSKSAAQIVLRWLVQQEGVIALSKTVSEERAKQNFKIFDFNLSGEEMFSIHKLAHPQGRLVSPDGLAPKWD